MYYSVSNAGILLGVCATTIRRWDKNGSMLYGYTIEMVDPKYSSKNCWKCGECGNRKSKIFLCTSCVKYQIDSDLNAARNLVLRSKNYKLILDAIRSKGRTP